MVAFHKRTHFAINFKIGLPDKSLLSVFELIHKHVKYALLESNFSIKVLLSVEQNLRKPYYNYYIAERSVINHKS